MEFYTRRGERPDLAAAVKASQILKGGYIFPYLFPIVNVLERAGTTAYRNSVPTLAAGTENRTNGVALAGVEVKNADLTWTTARLEGRSYIYENEVKAYGDIDGADEAGGVDAGRLAMNKAETKAMATIFSTARTTAAVELADQSVIKILQDAADKVTRYGAPYLLMSNKAWRAFCNIPEIRSGMFHGLTGTGNLGFMAMQNEQVRTLVSNWMMFEGILIFDPDIVGATYDNYIGVVGLRKDTFSGNAALVKTCKRYPCYGVSYFYLPDAANADVPFRISSSDDRDQKRNVYDAEGYYGQYEMNGAAVQLTKFASAYTMGKVTTVSAA